MDSFPHYWKQPFKGDHDCIKIDKNSDEFMMIEKLMKTTIYKEGHDNKYGLVPGEKRDPKDFEVKQIIRVQSMELWQVYHTKRAEIMVQYRREKDKYDAISKYINNRSLLVPAITPSINEYYLFHGTEKGTVQKILEGGFDARFSSPMNMFGAGIYFAENSSKSNQYIPCTSCNKGSIPRKDNRCNCKKVSEPYAMILSRVILGNPYVCTRDSDRFKVDPNGEAVYIPIPKEACQVENCCAHEHHSVLGESRANGGTELRLREYIVYNGAQTYPEYIVYFNRK